MKDGGASPPELRAGFIYLTVVGLLLLTIGLVGAAFAFSTFERLVCGSTVVIGVLLCFLASRVSRKRHSKEITSPRR